MVFYSWDSMKFFAMNRFKVNAAGDGDNKGSKNSTGYNNLFSKMKPMILVY